MKAKDFEQAFDDGEDILESLDLSKAKRSMQDKKRVNVDFPAWMIESFAVCFSVIAKQAKQLRTT
jgi:uncharacterized protein YfeS